MFFFKGFGFFREKKRGTNVDRSEKKNSPSSFSLSPLLSFPSFRAPDYGAAADVWAAGCVIAELLTSRPLFPGETEADDA